MTMEMKIENTEELQPNYNKGLQQITFKSTEDYSVETVIVQKYYLILNVSLQTYTRPTRHISHI